MPCCRKGTKSSPESMMKKNADSGQSVVLLAGQKFRVQALLYDRWGQNQWEDILKWHDRFHTWEENTTRPVIILVTLAFYRMIIPLNASLAGCSKWLNMLYSILLLRFYFVLFIYINFMLLKSILVERQRERLSLLTFLGTEDTGVHIVHISHVIITYTLK